MKTPSRSALWLMVNLVAGCGSRPAAWDAPVTHTPPLATPTQAIVIDGPAERALVVSVGADLEASFASVPIGRNAAAEASAVTPDGARVLVLCRGNTPRRTEDDQPPALHVLDGRSPAALARYELTEAAARLVVDPLSRFAVVTSDGDGGAFVTNPNELLIVDLARPPSQTNPAPVSLRSFGGRPERLDFTPTLALPGGKHRLLVAQSDRDLSIVDLDDLSRPEITVKLTGGSTAPRPGGFAVSDGDPTSSDDAQLAVFLRNDASLVLVDLSAPTASDPPSAAFRPTPNVIGLPGPATDLAFVETDGGRRVAATIPSRATLTLVEPATGVSTDIALGASFDHISLVPPESTSAAASGDVALLWSTSAPQVAFVALESTVGKSYKSVQVVPLPVTIARVIDVPPPNDRRKVLVSTSGDRLFVLDLPSRTVSPLAARSSTGVDLVVSPDGDRLWLNDTRAPDLASVDLATLHPVNLLLERSAGSVVEIARSDGGRALLAFHPRDAAHLTILDALAPSTANSRGYENILAGALP